MKTRLGLIEQSYDTDKDLDGQHTLWERFEHKVRTMNRETPQSTQYKVLYMGRHGEGDHNVAEAFYGTEKWDVCYLIPLLNWLYDANATAVLLVQIGRQ